MRIILPAIVALLLTATASTGQTVQSEDSDMVFTKVEKEATFPGGLKGWASYLRANLNAELGNKCIKLKKKEKLAQQTVKVQFIVDRNGDVSNVMVLNKDEVHPKLGAEAMRVIKEGPKWQPAMQNGKKVIYQALQNITWQVTAE